MQIALTVDKDRGENQNSDNDSSLTSQNEAIKKLSLIRYLNIPCTLKDHTLEMARPTPKCPVQTHD